MMSEIIYIKASSKRAAVCGGAPPDLFEGAWRAAEERVKNDPGLCIVPDIESGYPVVMTQARRQEMFDFFEMLRPKEISPAVKGIVFFGTSGLIDDNKSLEDVFYKGEV